MHQESLSLCFLCLLLGQEGRERSQPWCSPFCSSCCPWSNLPHPGAAAAWCCGGLLPCAPLESPWWVSVCQFFQCANSFSEHGLLFIFSWSRHWSYPSTSPGGLVYLSVFAYYKTFGPVFSVTKVRIPHSQEYWSSWHLAQLIAERSTPVVAQRANSVLGAAWWASLSL